MNGSPVTVVGTVTTGGVCGDEDGAGGGVPGADGKCVRIGESGADGEHGDVFDECDWRDAAVSVLPGRAVAEYGEHGDLRDGDWDDVYDGVCECDGCGECDD